MYLIRHGQTTFNVVMDRSGRDPGIRDAPLTPLGAQQIEGAVMELRDRKITKILASPFTRALQSAQILAEGLGGLPIVVEPLLSERRLYSCDVGTPASLLKATWSQVDFEALTVEEWWNPIPESQRELQVRLRAFEKKWSATEAGDTLLGVTHWYFLNALVGGDPSNGEVVQLDARGQARRF